MAAYECDHRNRLIGITEYEHQQNVLSTVAYAFDVFDRRIGKSVECDGLGGPAPSYRSSVGKRGRSICNSTVMA